MKWSSQPGASTGMNASSTLAPERAIAALNASICRLIACGPLDLIGPRAITRSVIGAIGFSPGTKNSVPSLHVGIELVELVALARRVPRGRVLAWLQRPHLDAGEMCRV